MRTKFNYLLIKLLSIFTLVFSINNYAVANPDQQKIKNTVDNVIQPLLQQYNIPGMAVAVTLNGENYFFNYGVASKETQQPVTNKTLFEIGSLSKTFTATLAAYAELNGKLLLTDSISKYFPSLQGSYFGNMSLLNLGTHTSGGLPLQVPDDIKNTEQLIAYFKQWQPKYAVNTHRSYSNISIGTLGMITAKSMNVSFTDAVEKKLFPMLGMNHSYIHVPDNQIKDYAQGYTKTNEPTRMSFGVLAEGAYGVKSNTFDLIRFIEANMSMIKLDEKLQRAIINTHTGYFKRGEMTQDLIWEQYDYPIKLEKILEGNSDAMIFRDTFVEKLIPPLPPKKEVWMNKTGGTNGFSVYAAFIPSKKIGIVMLANKNYPIAPRVKAAYELFEQIEKND